MKYYNLLLLTLLLLCHCQPSAESDPSTPTEKPFDWRNATIYFLLTDRFYNGNPENDVNFERNQQSALLRGFEGGDIAGISQKIQEGYFDSLGITAIWFAPIVEQIHGAADEGTGLTYAYHGYWAKDWTALDPNFGTMDELKEMVLLAHQHGIRVIMDVVANHTGPVTALDPQWPDTWVRTSPSCTYQDYESTVECTLVENLPDLHTESEEAVALPVFLEEKWKAEGRYETEMQELDIFFQSTGYPKAPKFYLIKWLSDYIRELGIDAFRVDTAKHTEAEIWAELKKQALKAFDDWKKSHPEEVLDESDFWMVGEVYNYSAANGQNFDYGDTTVNFYNHGFEALINFDFKYDAEQPYESIFSKYENLLYQGSLEGKNILNYLSSHDDASPYDPYRQKSREAASKLLLSQGAAQMYYGDESDRLLVVDGAEGDAGLRSNMNWDALNAIDSIQDTFEHWSKLGKFRQNHIAVGAGRHYKMSDAPYTFSRIYEESDFTDKVIIVLDAEEGEKQITVNDFFEEGTRLKDAYSGVISEVKNGRVVINSPHGIVLLAEE